MTSSSTIPPQLLELTRPGRLSAELLDGITDAVLCPAGPIARADTICRLVGEIYASVAWLDADLDADELTSLHRVVDEAKAHHARVIAGRAQRDSTADGVVAP